MQRCNSYKCSFQVYEMKCHGANNATGPVPAPVSCELLPSSAYCATVATLTGPTAPTPTLSDVYPPPDPTGTATNSDQLGALALGAAWATRLG